MSLEHASLLVVALLSGSAFALSLRAYLWTAPRSVSRHVARLEDTIREVSEVAQATQVDWRRAKTELAASLEALDDLLERVERKRASAASAASRAERATGGRNGDVASISDRGDRMRAARERARQLGIPV